MKMKKSFVLSAAVLALVFVTACVSAASAVTFDSYGYVEQTEITATTEPQSQGALKCEARPGVPTYSCTLLFALDGIPSGDGDYGFNKLGYDSISLLTEFELVAEDSDIQFDDPYKVMAVLTPGITVPDGAELRAFLLESRSEPILDCPAEYNAETKTVTFTIKGGYTIPYNLVGRVYIAVVNSPIPPIMEVDTSNYVEQNEISAADDDDGALGYYSFENYMAADEIVYYGRETVTKYKTVSALAAFQIRYKDIQLHMLDQIPLNDSSFVLDPGITVPDGTELRAFVSQADNSEEPPQSMQDFPAVYDAATKTVTINTGGEIEMPSSFEVYITAVTKPGTEPEPAPSGGGGGGCSAGWGALALLAAAPLFARRKK